MKFAKEGYPFIGFFLTLTVISAFSGPYWATGLAVVLTLFMFYFFRDPDRLIPIDESAFISPADGKIIRITEAVEDEVLKTMCKKISIFMSPLNVHVNRSPAYGIVREVQHHSGKFYSAFTDDASILNEHITMMLETAHGPIVVKQIAGSVARRCVCRVAPGAKLQPGQRYGVIKFSSRADVFLPMDSEISVQIGDKVLAGETILATRQGADSSKIKSEPCSAAIHASKATEK
ncbi:MAG: phosphatidylserine decarboxylase family protein [Nitrospira sp.]|nr:phosphatidylserine decarboxylase family protein [bacterium]MBL7049731.1 phosphatidylserine decarboxylase family protein [Nitrospira sp.]